MRLRSKNGPRRKKIPPNRMELEYTKEQIKDFKGMCGRW